MAFATAPSDVITECTAKKKNSRRTNYPAQTLTITTFPSNSGNSRAIQPLAYATRGQRDKIAQPQP